MRQSYHNLTLLLALALTGGTTAAVRAEASGDGQAALDRAAEQNEFTFLVFYKANDPITQSMRASLNKHLAARGGNEAVTDVSVSAPSEAALVNKLGLRRAPMPLCIVFAPNGAITGMFQKAPAAKDIENAFVTPTMTRCMKAMQSGKIVLICVQSGQTETTPAAVSEFQASEDFKDRVATVDLDINDPAEKQFLKQMELDRANKDGIATVMLAPPGVLVGKFVAEATMDEIAAELHAAGKCCDDPNCKHHKKSTAQNQSPNSSATKRK